MFKQCLKIKEMMAGYDGKWGIAGGWAIDLYYGKETRQHHDIEIAIIREEQMRLKLFLKDWSFNKVVNGKLLPWTEEFLSLPIHEIHGTRYLDGVLVEVLLNEVEKGSWIFRRDNQITYPENQMFCTTIDGIPYLHPLIVLLYKAKNMREKDHQDFLTIKDKLSNADREWLKRALSIHQFNHPWIERLEEEY